MTRPQLTFVVAVGPPPLKQELDPALMASSKVVVDIMGRCSAIGDLQHAHAAGAINLGGFARRTWRTRRGQEAGAPSEEEIIFFDSTGTALQDVLAAAVVYERALRAGVGVRLNLAG